MSRNATTYLVFMITVVGIQITTGSAQEVASAPGTMPDSNRAMAGTFNSSQLLAQNDSPSLVDRLRAIRNTVTSDYSEPRDEETTTEPNAADSAGRALRMSALPSVLIRRPSGHSVSPSVESGTTMENRTEPSEDRTTTTAAAAAESRARAEISVSDDASSRRTSRRMRTQTSTTSNSTPFRSMSPSMGEQVTLASQGPVMRVELTGPKTIAMGKQAPYRIRLINQGDAAAQGVTVSVTIPDAARIGAHQVRIGTVNQKETHAGSQTIVWQVDQVPARSQHDLALSLEPVKNQPIELKLDWKFRPMPFSGRITVLQPKLTIAISGPSEARYGETHVFKIKISNPGNGPAEGVKIDLRATGVSNQPNQIGTLPAGESRELEVELTARQAGIMQFLATATGDGQLKAEARHDVQVRRPELAVQIEAPQLLYSGSTATYQVRIANRGDAEAKDVILHFDLPAGVVNGIGIDSKPITTDQPKWRLGNLAAGIERLFTLKLDLIASGKNHLTVRAENTNNLSASDTVTTMVESIADLKLTVNDPKGPIPVGQDITYEINVVNRGTKEAHDISVIAQFADGIEPSSTNGQRAEIVPGQVIFDSIHSLPAGGEITLRITAQAHKAGSLRFRAELTCTDPETELVSEESTRFYDHAALDGSSTNSASLPERGPTPARR